LLPFRWCSSVNPPFTVEQFFDVFRRYNEAVWPWQMALVALGLGAAVLALARPEKTARLVSGILAFLWAWMAIEYHWRFFAGINPAARLFALVFLMEAAAIAWLGVIRERLVFEPPSMGRRSLAVVFCAYAFIAYPYLGFLAGHRYPATPTFGVPCPTTILTLGILGFAVRGPSRLLLVVPLLWSALGGYAAFRLGVPQDFGLLAAGVITVASLLWRGPDPYDAGRALQHDRSARHVMDVPVEVRRSVDRSQPFLPPQRPSVEE
jgi:hypothetical protein